MALIKCNECQREISDKAVSCPGCGAPIAVSNPPSPEAAAERKFLMWAAAVAAIFVLAFIWFRHHAKEVSKRRELAADFGVPLKTYDGYSDAWKEVACKLKAQKELQDYGAASAADNYQRCLKRHGVKED